MMAQPTAALQQRPLQQLRQRGAALAQTLTALLAALAFKVVQVVVGTGFAFALYSLAAVALVQRLIITPEALSKVRKNGLEGAARRAAVAPGAVAAGGKAAAGSDDGEVIIKASADGAAPLRLRAVAVEPSSERPIHLHNEPEQGHDSEVWRLVGPYVRLYGRNAIANSQLYNPEFIHFFLPGVGSLPYICADSYGRVVVSAIGDPLAHPSRWRELTELFLEEFPDAFFYHASEAYAAALDEMGLLVNDVGAETTLQVQHWAYTQRTRTVRAAARAAREAGVRVRELAPHELDDEMRRRLEHDVSGDWLRQKAVADRELRVFVRSVAYQTMQLRDGVRIFVAEQYDDPRAAPPAVVDPALQGAAANAKPPKPPRRSRSAAAALLSAGGAAAAGRAPSRGKLSSPSLAHSPSSASIASVASAPAAMLRIGGSGGSSPAAPSSPACSDRSALTASPSAATSIGCCSIGSSISIGTSSLAPSSPPPSIAGTSTPADEPSSPAPPLTPLPSTSPASQQQEQQEQEQQQRPRLAGFVLLDPLWERGEVVGYVSSIVRMRRSAHSGTLKLLYEDVVSALRREGKRELAFGFAPFFNIVDRFASRCLWVRLTCLYLYHCANNLYAFKNLAFSKIRYGAGVSDDKRGFRDPNVTMTHVYMGSRNQVALMPMLDLYVLCMYVGFMDNVGDTWLKLVGLTKGGANLAGGGLPAGAA